MSFLRINVSILKILSDLILGLTDRSVPKTGLFITFSSISPDKVSLNTLKHRGHGSGGNRFLQMGRLCRTNVDILVGLNIPEERVII